MATVRPFRGVTFDPTRVPDLAEVTCPPYDVISHTDRDELYARHPYNIVRIVSGREEAGDDDEQNKYTRACGFFRSWLWEGVLREDAEEALFVYRQAFDDPRGRLRRVWGLLGTMSLDDEILAHEKTMPGPKADRLALMKAIPANLSPIYALYREEGGGVSSSLSSLSHEAPVADFVDADGKVRHTVWAVHDQVFHEKVTSSLAECPLLIADGHHRFETAKAYRDGRRGSDGPGPWDSILTLLVDVSTQPVCILPYHRIVLRVSSADPLNVIEERFDVERLGNSSTEKVDAFADALWDDDRPPFGFFFKDDMYALRPKTQTDDIPAGILARDALGPLGVGSAQDDLAFTPDAQLVRDEVASGRAACGFLIPPVDVEAVWGLASSGATMPEKSTYFFPKPRDGIVVRPMEPC